MSGVIAFLAGTGQTLYAQLMDLSTGKVANGSTFEVYNQAHWADYVIALSEQAGSGRYVVAMPGYVPAGRYMATAYVYSGSPASGDTPIDDVKIIDWDGGSMLGLFSSLNVGKINGSSVAAASLALAAAAYAPGAAAAGTLSTTQMTTNLTSTVANAYAGRIVYFTSGVNAGRAALITAYAVTGGKLTFIGYGNVGLPVAPSANDTFFII